MSCKIRRPKPTTAGRRVEIAIAGAQWVAVLSGVALLISGYLLVGSLRGEHLPGCGPDSGCDAVLASRWASWFGFPVSALAVLAYLVVLGGLRLLPRLSAPAVRRRLPMAFAAVGMAILGAAVWFVLLQVAVIRAICPFCMMAHACGLGVGILLLRSQRGQPGLGGGVILGGGMLCLLVLGQMVYRPAKYEVSAIPATTLQTPRAQSAGAPAQPAIPFSEAGSDDPFSTAPAPRLQPTPRLLQVHEGLFTLDLSTVPVIGSSDAPQVVLHFFDYTCEHCRELHPILTQVQHALDDRLATVHLPIPLDPDCNPIMKRPLARHTNACVHARLALAVWRADRQHFAGFEDWIFSFPTPPDPGAAHREAARRVGADALAIALRDPWIEEYLALGIRLYHTNYLRFQKSQLPLLMTGTNLVSGTVRSTNDLYRILGITP